MSVSQKSISRSTTLPPSLTVVDRPVPTPGEGEVLVRVKAAALNPVDWKAWQYPDKVTFIKSSCLGTDISGIVEAVGEGASGLAVGDRVYVVLSFNMIHTLISSSAYRKETFSMIIVGSKNILLLQPVSQQRFVTRIAFKGLVFTLFSRSQRTSAMSKHLLYA